MSKFDPKETFRPPLVSVVRSRPLGFFCELSLAAQERVEFCFRFGDADADQGSDASSRRGTGPKTCQASQ